MEFVRVTDIPSQLAVSSGISTEEDHFAIGGLLWRFDRWMSAQSAKLGRSDFPRDFMWFDREAEGLVWIYTFDELPEDCEEFERTIFEGGLYACACSHDGDDKDGEEADAFVRSWVEKSEVFELDEGSGRYPMFRIISSHRTAQILGYHQLEVLVPIKEKTSQKSEEEKQE